MGNATKIEWADATWNPIHGCTPISKGCHNCYAERMAARRLPALMSPTDGEPFAVMTKAGPRWTGRVELIEAELEKPSRWLKPRRIFVNSISDTFHERVPDEWIERIFEVMKACPQHVFMVLTKREHRMRHVLGRAAWWADAAPERRSHICLGVSIENQFWADRRIPHLLETPAALRFLSVEPLLGPVDLNVGLPTLDVEKEFMRRHLVNWVIAGGESGPGARACDVEWIRAIVRQCRAADVPCFVKQLGSNRWWPYSHPEDLAPIRDLKGGNPNEWPEDLRVREHLFLKSQIKWRFRCAL